MNTTAREQILSAMDGPVLASAIRKGRLVENLSGGGFRKKLLRLFLTPDIYIPYLLIVKARVYRKNASPMKLFWGEEISIPLQDYDSLALRSFGFAGGTEAELKLLRYIVFNLSETDIFYDVGANWGFFTYLAKGLCSEVHSFEPMPYLANAVRTNTMGSNVKVNEVALSDTEGETTLHVSESSGLSTINTDTLQTHSYEYRSADSLSVRTTTLDVYGAAHSRPTFLKIDVEGAEELVIKGASNLLHESAPVIALEIWGKDNGGETSMRAVQRLLDLGYNSYTIRDDGTLSEAQGDLSLLVPPKGGDNLIFKKN